MGKLAGTIIGGGIGWALFGPLGALIGAYIGNVVTNESGVQKKRGKAEPGATFATYGDTRAGDFAVAMLALFAYVSKSDRNVKSSEVQYVKKFLVDKFGTQNAQDLLYLYREILGKDYNIYDIAHQVRDNMDYYSRMELLHVLFGIAAVDGDLHTTELQVIREIADALGISDRDYETIRAIFGGGTNRFYEILGIKPNDDVEIIKKAYRDLAVKYHPDKVANLGPEFQKLAEEKFKSINDAYQTIRKERGF
ncbi:MAG TPA: TerB family tellurite resistance protein [Candidatus Marinimicrobia bacterium]|nr:TerB family tellurite resistance protein [Candidatus Neomarinimicrobiota bacterium]HQH56587.1 TerB family tellurite resistance protein [Candidatus Neomarinimicrobiota bacterium]HQK11779.1 TerB family tellurite resistance protein [Candidatus Neomarinimicrobiota bacterium]